MYNQLLLGVIDGIQQSLNVPKLKRPEARSRLSKFFKYTGLIFTGAAFAALPIFAPKLIQNQLFTKCVKGANAILDATSDPKDMALMNQQIQEKANDIYQEALHMFKTNPNENQLAAQSQPNQQVKNPIQLAQMGEPQAGKNNQGAGKNNQGGKNEKADSIFSSYFAYFRLAGRLFKKLIKYATSNPDKENEIKLSNENALKSLINSLMSDIDKKPLLIFDEVQYLIRNINCKEIERFFLQFQDGIRNQRLHCFLINTDNSIYSTDSAFKKISPVSYLMMPQLKFDDILAGLSQNQKAILEADTSFYKKFFTNLSNIQLVKKLFQFGKTSYQILKLCKQKSEQWRGKTHMITQRTIFEMINKRGQLKLSDKQFKKQLREFEEDIKKLISSNVLFYNPKEDYIEMHYPYYDISGFEYEEEDKNE